MKLLDELDRWPVEAFDAIHDAAKPTTGNCLLSTVHRSLAPSRYWTALERLPIIAELARRAQTCNSPTLKTQLEETIHIVATWDAARLEANRKQILEEAACRGEHRAVFVNPPRLADREPQARAEELRPAVAEVEEMSGKPSAGMVGFVVSGVSPETKGQELKAEVSQEKLIAAAEGYLRELKTMRCKRTRNLNNAMLACIRGDFDKAATLNAIVKHMDALIGERILRLKCIAKTLKASGETPDATTGGAR